MLFELHQIKQIHSDFKKDVYLEVNNLQMKQQMMEKSFEKLSCDLNSTFNKCYVKLNEIGNTRVRNNSTDPGDEIQNDIRKFQSKVDICFHGVQNSIRSVENVLSAVKVEIDKVSKDSAAEFRKTEFRQRQVQESLSATQENVKETKAVMTEIEKSITFSAKQEQFIEPTTVVRATTAPAESSNITLDITNRYGTLSKDDDPDIKHDKEKKKETNKKVQTKEIQKEDTRNEERIKKSQYKTNNVRRSQTSYVLTRREVYLIGDSLSGQVNAASLGKATQTYVQKLRAPKIEDIKAYSKS